MTFQFGKRFLRCFYFSSSINNYRLTLKRSDFCLHPGSIELQINH